MTPVIHAEGLSKRYGDVGAVHGLDLIVERGVRGVDEKKWYEMAAASSASIWR